MAAIIQDEARAAIAAAIAEVGITERGRATMDAERWGEIRRAVLRQSVERFVAPHRAPRWSVRAQLLAGTTLGGRA